MSTKPHFIFTKLHNSFSVYVKNLEQLTVPEIQIIETFVSIRNGLFDFNTYTFFVPKNLEFNDFVFLLKHVNINAFCEEKILLPEKKKGRVEFGRYKGLDYSELPDSYLLWLKSNYSGKNREIIDAELKSRNL